MIVGSAVAAGILAGAYFGMAIYFCFHFLPGTRINGMDCSMKTAETGPSRPEKERGDKITHTGQETAIRGDMARSREERTERAAPLWT